ncbi:Arc family DNA-binding protein [Acidovorax sp. K2F]|uniref:Arc family DNA-binding protein n=1 Tax=Acidovorax sp. K2F TaxID=2978125 RepID=UPI0021B138B9|nr:Arc family DNA-binding protein [Acidovorax sp. K2F]MCT6720033.1 Arc family DNA-binding protein [Acidovorax sp. K2F]
MTDRHQLTPTPVRIPLDFKAQLKAEAKANDRSLNGEILARLRSTFKAKRSTSTQQKGKQS